MVQKNSLRSLHCCLNSPQASAIHLNDNKYHFIARHIFITKLCISFAQLVSPRGWALPNFVLPNVRYLPTPGPPSSFWTYVVSHPNITTQEELTDVTLHVSTVGCSWINQRGGSYQGYNMTDCHVNIHASFY